MFSVQAWTSVGTINPIRVLNEWWVMVLIGSSRVQAYLNISERGPATWKTATEVRFCRLCNIDCCCSITSSLRASVIRCAWISLIRSISLLD